MWLVSVVTGGICCVFNLSSVQTCSTTVVRWPW